MPADPLPYPVSEMLTLNVVDTLGGVSTAAGYKVTLEVERAVRPPQRPRPFLAVVYEGDDEPADPDDVPEGMVGWVRPYGVLVWCMDSETNDTSDTLCNLARADVEKAVMQDPTRGGYARNTTLDPPLKLDDPNEPAGIIVAFRCLYTTLWNDPYRLG